MVCFLEGGHELMLRWSWPYSSDVLTAPQHPIKASSKQIMEDTGAAGMSEEWPIHWKESLLELDKYEFVAKYFCFKI